MEYSATPRLEVSQDRAGRDFLARSTATHPGGTTPSTCTRTIWTTPDWPNPPPRCAYRCEGRRPRAADLLGGRRGGLDPVRRDVSIGEIQVCLVVPTLTWQAYASNRAPFSFTEEARVDAALGLYDRHSDGSPVIVCSRRKPTRSGNPTAGIRSWGAHTIAADLYLVHWLEHLNRPYDVLSDHDLHARPSGSLNAYSCVILSSHPEYWTGPMRDTLDAYLGNGGRLMYLGGNGLYWVTSLHRASPWLMEVRKSGEGVGRRGDAVGAGEMQRACVP